MSELPTVDIREVVTELGLRKGKRKGNYTEYYCEVHDGNTPDLCVYSNDFVCYSSANKSGGGALSLVMHIKQYNSVERAVEWLREHFPEKDWEDIDQETLDRRKASREVLNKATEWSHQALKKEHSPLHEHIKETRNFDDDLIDETKIGFMSIDTIDTLKQRFDKQALTDSGLFYEKDSDLICQMYRRIVFPYTRGEQTWYMIGRKPSDYSGPEKYRQILSDSNAKYKKLIENDTLNRHIIYEWHQDRENQNTVVITEGVTDAISAHRAGYNVSSPVTTQYSDRDIKKVCNRVSDFKNVYIVMDGDSEGWKGAKKTAQILAENGVEAQLVRFDREIDLDDWTTENGYEIDSLLDDADLYLDILFDEVEEADRRTISEKKRKVWSAIRAWDEEQKTTVFKEMPGSKADNRKQFKKWLDEYQEQQKKREAQKKTETTPNSEDTDDAEADITENLRLRNGKTLNINPTPDTYVNRLEITAAETKVNGHGSVDTDTKFKVYEIQFGEGEDENTYKLITDPYQQISLGENFLPIKVADLSKPCYRESKYFKEQYRELKRKSDDFSKSYSEWLRSIEGTDYLELAEEIDGPSKDLVMDLSNDQILSLIEEYLISGYNTDPKLRTVMYPKIIRHSRRKVDPNEVAPYQPHTQMWTNTKVGKSYTGDRVGRKLDDATPAGLVGYADSDGKQNGILDGLTSTVFVDEFNFGASSRQLNDQLLNLMERGIHEQTKAGHSIKTRFYGPLSYLANPKDGQQYPDDDDEFEDYRETGKTSFELVSQFEELIQFLGMNIQAMASRFGVIVFDEDMEKATKDDKISLSRQRKRKLETFTQWVIKQVAPKYSEIEEELEDWLEQPYEDEYRETVMEHRDEIHNDIVQKFWKNHLESYRHARGQALRMAVYQNIGGILKDDYTFEDLREEAEAQWQTVKEVNLDSLENMTAATDNETAVSRSRAKLDSQEPKYTRLFIKTLVRFYQEKDSAKVGNYHAFDQLRSVYSGLRDDLPDEDVTESSRYYKWSRVKQNMADNIHKKRIELEQKFGVEVRRSGEDFMVRVRNPDRFNNFLELEIGGQSTGDTGRGDSDGSDGRSEEDSSEDNGYAIKGEYNLSRTGVRDMIEDNAENYDGNLIPRKDLKIYFGRKFGSRWSKSKEKMLDDAITELLSEGSIREAKPDMFASN
ncbi:toprim domain-containing protein [Halococcus sediminicola]|uniref:toprim domain-containing protein n=1 Tax=Halococcus sediminicola TaxID=1264579 RepID=UPI000679BBDC|nr:toprim domain-containing protein [Halococcus sediminicola]